MMKNTPILVVDDEDDLREILRFNLENEGYDVDTAASAEEALGMLDNGYRLILLDVMMTGMSGFQMAEKMRKAGDTTPIIFLTAKDTENDLLTGFSVGGDDYIAKPFSVKEVAARVKAVLKRNLSAGAAATTEISVGGIRIDPAMKSVRVKETSVSLTKTEFELLLMLARNPNHVFSREEILSKVWESDVYVLERTVDVHITRLRKKLGDEGKRIINRSGYGYCLEN